MIRRTQEAALRSFVTFIVFLSIIFFFCSAEGCFFVSSLGEVDDRDPLVHAAALVAEAMHFPQRLVLPRRRTWTLKGKKKHRVL